MCACLRFWVPYRSPGYPQLDSNCVWRRQRGTRSVVRTGCLRGPTRRWAVFRRWDRPIGARFELRLAAPAAGLAPACHQDTPRAVPPGGGPCSVVGIDPPERDSNCAWLRQPLVSLPTAPRAVSASPHRGGPCPVAGIDPSERDSNCVWLRQPPVFLRRDIKLRLRNPTRRFESSRPDGSKHQKGPLSRAPLVFWSAREDSNLRPLPPQGSALPGCATRREPLTLDRVGPQVKV